MRRAVLVGVGLVSLLGGLGATAPATPADAAAQRSTTTLSLSASQTQYGQTVRATASVVALEGPAEGDVHFEVDGTTIKANLTGAGTATVLLPKLVVGDHTVQARYVPFDSTRQFPSSSQVQTWVIERAEVDLQVRVSGARPRSVARAHLGAQGVFGTVPLGEMRVRWARQGGGAKSRTVKLNDQGMAVVRLGVLAPGRYKLTAAYSGGPNHRPRTRAVRFKVGR